MEGNEVRVITNFYRIICQLEAGIVRNKHGRNMEKNMEIPLFLVPFLVSIIAVRMLINPIQ